MLTSRLAGRVLQIAAAVLLALVLLAPAPSLGQGTGKLPDFIPAGYDDYQNMLDQLGIKQVRKGRDPRVSHLIDYFEDHPESGVDAKKVCITGVSRYGKAALVATAFDPRVAAGFVASSGAGGAKLFRRDFGELLENLASGRYIATPGLDKK